MTIVYKVDVEFLVGINGSRGRKTFPDATTVEFAKDKHLMVRTMTGEEFYVKYDQITWLHTEPLPGDENPIDKEIVAILKHDSARIIPAIKRYRELTNQGLKESREYVEKVRDKYFPKAIVPPPSYNSFDDPDNLPPHAL